MNENRPQYQQLKQQGAISKLWDMLCNTLTMTISVVNRGATALDNYAAVAEADSASYLEQNNIVNDADLRSLKKAAESES